LINIIFVNILVFNNMMMIVISDNML